MERVLVPFQLQQSLLHVGQPLQRVVGLRPVVAKIVLNNQNFYSHHDASWRSPVKSTSIASPGRVLVRHEGHGGGTRPVLAVISVVVVAAVPVAAAVVPPGGGEVVAEAVCAGIVILVDVRSV